MYKNTKDGKQSITIITKPNENPWNPVKIEKEADTRSILDIILFKPPKIEKIFSLKKPVQIISIKLYYDNSDRLNTDYEETKNLIPTLQFDSNHTVIFNYLLDNSIVLLKTEHYIQITFRFYTAVDFYRLNDLAKTINSELNSFRYEVASQSIYSRSVYRYKSKTQE